MRPTDERQVLLPIAMARWAESRLHECVGFWFAAPRLYTMELIDPHVLDDPAQQGARMTFVGEHVDESELALGAGGAEACRGDAAVMVTTRWSQVAADRQLLHPGRHPQRRRVRVVIVISDAGTATARRFEHDDTTATVCAGLSAGGAGGLRLAATWHGVRGS